MKIGVMNDPRRPVLDEIRWIGEHGFHYVDLTVEAPQADPDTLPVSEVARLLGDLGLGVVVHAAPYLPIDNPSPLVRRAALDEMYRTLDIAARLGASLMTVHFIGWPEYLTEAQGYELYRQLCESLCKRGTAQGVRVALENSPRNRHQLKYFREIFARVPDLGLLLDVGHANVNVAKHMTREYLFALADRLVHVHLSDNDGTDDEHLPFVAPRRGAVDWPRVIGDLRTFGYDGTITLEVFSEDRAYLLRCREQLLQWWDAATPTA